MKIQENTTKMQIAFSHKDSNNSKLRELYNILKREEGVFITFPDFKLCKNLQLLKKIMIVECKADT